ncbi:peptidoglycan DD-metalloendopeptidase family protein [Alicyclobacillus fodiniaquatilis]|uniref:Peptidoglycan DD-metalloendopeptidase family protein n=1 Tax=Alicyclobacillus fodiniaquatilis TaxID=1661150 RepID=A0ABW4JF16_9BACL
MADVKRKWPWQAKHTTGANLQSRSEIDADTSSRRRFSDTSASDEPNTTSVEAIDDSMPAPSRWVSEGNGDLSPYGFVDEDGGMRQVESGTWRNAFGAKRPQPTGKRFVARTTSTSPPSGTGGGVKQKSYASTLLWQAFCAAMLVGIGYFVEHSPQPLAQTIASESQGVFQTDYTAKVQPEITKAFQDLHVTVPSFGGSAVQLHTPIAGDITEDYSSNHPEISISASANQAVKAAGSGTVTAVTKSGNAEILKIDNGDFGTSVYTGLGSINVKLHEYVSSGEVVGKLPAKPSHPILQFSMLKNGKYENPHQFIDFPGDGQ